MTAYNTQTERYFFGISPKLPVSLPLLKALQPKTVLCTGLLALKKWNEKCSPYLPGPARRDCAFSMSAIFSILTLILKKYRSVWVTVKKLHEGGVAPLPGKHPILQKKYCGMLQQGRERRNESNIRRKDECILTDSVSQETLFFSGKIHR